MLDYRNWKEKKGKLPLFKDAVYYYEGLEKFSDREIISRYQLSKKGNLVLLTCPPSLDIFKGLICSNKPSKIVLTYSKSDICDANIFLKQLIVLRKYIIGEKGGQLDVHQLAAKTGHIENTILAGLQYLEAKGLIRLNNFNSRFFIVRMNESAMGNWKVKERELLSLIKESNSFKLIESNLIYDILS